MEFKAIDADEAILHIIERDFKGLYSRELGEGVEVEGRGVEPV